jgi:hypothetical protein
MREATLSDGVCVRLEDDTDKLESWNSSTRSEQKKKVSKVIALRWWIPPDDHSSGTPTSTTLPNRLHRFRNNSWRELPRELHFYTTRSRPPGPYSKPGNLAVDGVERERPRVVIVDFGLSVIVEDD